MEFTRLLLKRKIVWIPAVVAIVGGSYWWYRSYQAGQAAAPRYVTAAAERGTLTVSVSGTGQVLASSQVEVKPKSSGTVVRVLARTGQEVAAGAILAQLDAGDAAKAVRDAELNLESAQLSLQKLKQPADQLALVQAENSLAAAEESKQKAEDDLATTYEDGFTAAANAFIDLPTIITGLHDTLYGSAFSASQWNLDYYVNAVKSYDEKVVRYRDDAAVSYQAARLAYDKNFSSYKSTDRSADRAVIASLVDETYATSKDLSAAVKDAYNLIQFYEDRLTERGSKPATAADAALTALNSYTGKLNTHIANLSGIKNSVDSDSQAITTAKRTIAEKTESLAKLKAGADALDIRTQELALKQRQSALSDARARLADYSVRTPISGLVAKMNIQLGDQGSSGSAVATVVGKQKLAEISLNEVDVSKIKLNQKSVLTFDAVPNLSLTGQVAEIDAIGAVSQGVVSYNVKIGFDTQDDRIKPGMSVSAAIITEVHADVLMVPGSAVKTSGSGGAYIEILTNGQAEERAVTVGSANDTMTEISGDVKAGDPVITQTITANSTSQPAGGAGIPLFGGARGLGGGTFRGNAAR